MTYKYKIVEYLNKRDNETYQLLDIFQRITPKHGGLHFFGYKLLKNEYEFTTIEITFTKSLREYSQLTKELKGLYYMTVVNKSKATLHTTDQYMAYLLKLSDGMFNEFAELNK